MSAPLEWKDPPARAMGGRGGQENKWRAIGVQLRAHPGQWALVDTRTSDPAAVALASRIRRGRLAVLGEGRFEAASDGRDVYARYVEGGSE